MLRDRALLGAVPDSGQQVFDPLRAVAVRPIGGNEIGIVVRHDLVVGGHDPPARGIDGLGQGIEGNLSDPLAFAVPAGRREPAVAASPQGHPCRRDEPDRTVRVGVEEVLLGAMEVAQGLAELRPVARPVDAVNGVRRAVVGP